MRIACAYEYSICTARGAEPFDKAKFEAVCNSLKQERPPAAIEQLLEVVKRFRISGGAGGTETSKRHRGQTIGSVSFRGTRNNRRDLQRGGYRALATYTPGVSG